MKLRLLCFSLMVFAPVSVADPEPTGFFSMPFKENQTGTNCSLPGMKQDQFHMEFNSDPKISKFHMGEDWNGKCGDDTDEGYPLFALAVGEVTYVRSSSLAGQGKRLDVRYSFPYFHGFDGVLKFDSVMLHLQSIESDITVGSKVLRGQKIATLGKTGTDKAHLHWMAETSLWVNEGTNPYNSILSMDKAIQYLSPSLIVDDRRDIYALVANPNNYSLYTLNVDAPSSIAYLYKDGVRKSLKKAISAGWIAKEDIIHESGGKWYYYSDINTNFFYKNRKYGFRTKVNNATFYVVVPGNNFQRDRARLDMINAVISDSRFVSLDTKQYFHSPDFDADWERHQMEFKLDTGEKVIIYHLTNKINPLIRYTYFYDPHKGNELVFTAVDKNKLY